MKNTYSYPPSENILKHGEIVKDSHFYCEGFLFLENDRKVRCNFEVAYTQAGNVNVICYISEKQGDSSMAVLDNSNSNSYNYPPKLIGRDLKSGLSIFVESLSLRTTSVSFSPTVSSSLYCVAKCSRAYISNKYLHSIDPQNYKTFSPYYEISGVDFPKWFETEHEFIFEVQENNSVTLYFQKFPEAKDYDNQPTGKLYVDFDLSIIDIETRDIADYWCGLFSLAVGKDVNWTVFGTNVQGLRVSYIEKTWQSQYLHEDMKFTPIIGRTNRSRNWNAISGFIKSGFKAVINKDLSKVEFRNLVMFIRSYIDYRLIKTETVEGEMRLLTTLTEEFLSEWEKSKNLKIPNIISRPERKKLEELLDTFLDENKEDFLDVDNLDKINDLKDKVIGEVHKSIRKKSLYERLFFFFEHYKLTQIDINNLKKRCKLFVDTRNSIAHDGLFAHYNEEYSSKKLVVFGTNSEPAYQVGYEIANVRMMIPLMIIAMIGYKGEFEDLLGKTWR